MINLNEYVEEILLKLSIGYSISFQNLKSLKLLRFKQALNYYAKRGIIDTGENHIYINPQY